METVFDKPLNKSIANQSIVNLHTAVATTAISLESVSGASMIERPRIDQSGDYVVLGGRLRFSYTSRTGSNPKAKVTIPNSKKADGDFHCHCGTSMMTNAARLGECIHVFANDGDGTITIENTETYANMPGSGTCVMIIPQTVIRVK